MAGHAVMLECLAHGESWTTERRSRSQGRVDNDFSQRRGTHLETNLRTHWGCCESSDVDAKQLKNARRLEEKANEKGA